VQHNGAVTILGIQRDGTADKPEQLTLTLRQALYVHELRQGRGWQRTDHLQLTLDPVAPTLLALSPAPLPALQASVAPATGRGSGVALHLSLAGASPAVAHAVHIEVADPTGKTLPLRAANVVLRSGAATWTFATVSDDATGVWTIRVRDMLGGGTADALVNVTP
jgi:hypothetical protein